eukprot:813524-Pyramimonas_sp.AAC.1
MRVCAPPPPPHRRPDVAPPQPRGSVAIGIAKSSSSSAAPCVSESRVHTEAADGMHDVLRLD